MLEFYEGIYDTIFKRIMLDSTNLDYLKTLIHLITKIPLNKLDNTIVLNNEILINKAKHKRSRVDILLKVEAYHIIIEMNKDFYYGIINKSYDYLYKVGSTLYEIGEKNYDDKPLILINFDNYDYFKQRELIYECQMKNKRSQIDNRNLTIFHVNLKYLQKNCYNKSVDELERLERYLMMLVADDEEKRKEVGGDDVILKKVNKTIEEFNTEKYRNIFDDIDERMYDELEKKYQYDLGIKKGKMDGRQSGILEGRQSGILEGRQSGILEGRQSEKRETAINLYNQNIPIDIILNATGLSKDNFMHLIGS